MKGKKLVGKLSPGKVKFKGEGKDIDSFTSMISLHDTVERQQKMGAPPVKHRLTMADGSKGFIRGNSKGVRSRLYKEAEEKRSNRYLKKIAQLAEGYNEVIKDDTKAMASAPKVNEKFFTRMKLRGC